jgi:hypothetical protein
MRALIFITLLCTGLTLEALEENARPQMPAVLMGMNEQKQITIAFAEQTVLEALILNASLPNPDLFEDEPSTCLQSEKCSRYREILLAHFAAKSFRLEQLGEELIRCSNSATSFREAGFEDEMSYKCCNQQFYEIVVPFEFRL